MNTTRIIAVALMVVGSGIALHAAPAQQPGIRRTDLQRHDLSTPGREVVQTRVDFAPGAAFCADAAVAASRANVNPHVTRMLFMLFPFLPSA